MQSVIYLLSQLIALILRNPKHITWKTQTCIHVSTRDQNKVHIDGEMLSYLVSFGKYGSLCQSIQKHHISSILSISKPTTAAFGVSRIAVFIANKLIMLKLGLWTVLYCMAEFC